jgi:hypothetical protein
MASANGDNGVKQSEEDMDDSQLIWNFTSHIDTAIKTVETPEVNDTEDFKTMPLSSKDWETVIETVESGHGLDADIFLPIKETEDAAEWVADSFPMRISDVDGNITMKMIVTAISRFIDNQVLPNSVIYDKMMTYEGPRKILEAAKESRRPVLLRELLDEDYAWYAGSRMCVHQNRLAIQCNHHPFLEEESENDDNDEGEDEDEDDDGEGENEDEGENDDNDATNIAEAA